MKQIKRTKISEALQLKSFGEEINVKGWVRTRRGNKNISFVALNDGSIISNIQIVIDIATFGEEYLKFRHFLIQMKRQALDFTL